MIEYPGFLLHPTKKLRRLRFPRGLRSSAPPLLRSAVTLEATS
ncbi:MAG: hypothetical protein ACRDN9_04980 [Streptosporangiaceae bacterium]